MEYLLSLTSGRPKLKIALFDFDGTLSTLRYGWESIMEPMMLEMISGPTSVDEDLTREIKAYIDISTGIQTIYQMQWLVQSVKRYGRNPGACDDPWLYKAEYNRRLMEIVEKRKADILTGNKSPENYMIKGSENFLAALKENGIEIYAASGTDHPDVINEAEILGLRKYFKDIAGAPPGKAACSKEAILRRLVYGNKLQGMEVAVIGDGKVEIALGREVGAITIGVASIEEMLCGINPVKRERLLKAGAHVITGDFENVGEILNWLDIK